jgi:YegS/Rv2252/BmrU family lipid kinase
MEKLAAIVANPAARKASREKIDLASRLLNRAGYRVIAYYTESKGHGIELARRAVSDGASMVIAAGGDGTFNEVMNALAGGDVPMGLLPAGTTNVLAKELRLPENVKGAIKRILSGAVHDVHVGRLVFPGGVERKFFLMASAGFDAWAVYCVDSKFKQHSGKMAYIMSGLKNLFSWNPGLLTVRADGEEHRASGVIVCKAASYGGYIKAAPDARLSEPHLYAVIMKGFGKRDVLRYAAGIILRRHTRFRDIVYRKCSAVEVLGKTHLQADGDYMGLAPVKIDVAPERLKLVY